MNALCSWETSSKTFLCEISWRADCQCIFTLKFITATNDKRSIDLYKVLLSCQVPTEKEGTIDLKTESFLGWVTISATQPCTKVL